MREGQLLLGFRLLGRGPPYQEEKSVLFRLSIYMGAYPKAPIQKCPEQNDVWPNCRAPCGPAQLTNNDHYRSRGDRSPIQRSFPLGQRDQLVSALAGPGTQERDVSPLQTSSCAPSWPWVPQVPPLPAQHLSHMHPSVLNECEPSSLTCTPSSPSHLLHEFFMGPKGCHRWLDSISHPRCFYNNQRRH